MIRVDFHLGFRVDPKINLYFREVLEDLVNSGEIKLESSFKSMKKHGFPADFKFILLDRIMLKDYKLTQTDNFILTIRGIVKHLGIPEERALHLDTTNTTVEQVPIIINSLLT